MILLAIPPTIVTSVEQKCSKYHQLSIEGQYFFTKKGCERINCQKSQIRKAIRGN